MGMFIHVEIHDDRCTGSECGQCMPVCPVVIFIASDGHIAVDAGQEDECTLCDLCLQVCPEDAITIHRLYREPPTAVIGEAALVGNEFPA